MRIELVLVLSLAGCAPTLSGQLHGQGQVFGPEARVNVTPLSHEGGLKGTSTLVLSVRPDGSFGTNEDLPAGDCLIEALVPGFALSAVHVNLGEKKKVDLDLKPLPATPVRATQLLRGIEDGRGSGGANLAPPSL